MAVAAEAGTSSATSRMHSTTPDLLRDLAIDVSVIGSVRHHARDISPSPAENYLPVVPPCERRCDGDVIACSIPPDQLSVHSSSSSKCQRSKRRRIKTTLTRVFCCLGWIFLCPCWAFGVCVREHPESIEDLREDPCWPCFYTGPPTT